MARTKAQKERDRQKVLEYLKSLPPEKLSKPAKWRLNFEESGRKYWIDHRALLK